MTKSSPSLILVVDDDSRSRELMTIILRTAGHEVMVAGDPQEAIALLSTARPALALVDYVMPGMNGVEFCRWVRLQDEHAALRLVLLTGMDSGEIHAEAQAAGADAVVTKPFDRVALLSRLNSLLGLPIAR
jgi:sigma-B regulation protein RsbU (phosphoserine phosphatase)